MCLMTKNKDQHTCLMMSVLIYYSAQETQGYSVERYSMQEPLVESTIFIQFVGESFSNRLIVSDYRIDNRMPVLLRSLQ